MNGLVLIIFYGSILFCFVVSSLKIYQYIKLPLHLRWESYRGSSIYEEAGYWQKKGIGLKYKLLAMFADLLTLRKYYWRNRKFWLVLFPFHVGVYLTVLWHVWLFIFPLTGARTNGVDWALIWGHTSTGLMLIGALGIFIKRLFDNELRSSYPRLHYLKWVLIILTLGTGFVAVELFFKGSISDVLDYVRYQLAFDFQTKLNPPVMTSLHVLTVAAVLIYLPFSHALRLFFRYYHELRWDYVPNVENGPVEKTIRRQLKYPIGWSANHVPAVQAWKNL